MKTRIYAAPAVKGLKALQPKVLCIAPLIAMLPSFEAGIADDIVSFKQRTHTPTCIYLL